MVLLISNDPLAPRQRLAEPLKPPAPGPVYLADADHLVVGRGRIAGASDGWLELADIEAVESTERFWFWDDAETVLSYNPDGRKREAADRPHQRRFRERLMKAYSGRCAVTGCAVPELLDAAHLMPWRIADEGILLRVDIHRMIDRGLADITDGQFRLRQRISGYEEYDGVRVSEPEGRNAD